MLALRTQSFKPVSSSTLPSSPITDLRFDPTGRKLAVGSVSTPNEAILYDLISASHKVLAGHAAAVTDLLWSHDGRILVTAAYDHNIKRWDGNTGELIHTIGRATDDPNRPGHGDKVQRLALHSSEPIFASAAEDKYLSPFAFPEMNFLLASPRGSQVAYANQSYRTLFVWNIETGALLHDFSFRPQEASGGPRWVLPLHELSFARGAYSHFLIAGTSDPPDEGPQAGELQIWDLVAAKCVRYKVKKKVQFPCIHTSPSGSSIFVTGCTNNKMYLWDLRALRSPVAQFAITQADPNIASMSYCERYLQCAGEDNCITVYDSRFSAHPLHILQHEKSVDAIVEPDSQGVMASQWSTMGSILISAGEDFTVRMWDVTRGTPLFHSVTGHEKAIAALALSSTGDLIASGGDDNRVVLYGLDNRFALNRDIT